RLARGDLGHFGHADLLVGVRLGAWWARLARSRGPEDRTDRPRPRKAPDCSGPFGPLRSPGALDERAQQTQYTQTVRPMGRMLLAHIQSTAAFETRVQPCEAGYGGTDV